VSRLKHSKKNEHQKFFKGIVLFFVTEMNLEDCSLIENLEVESKWVHSALRPPIGLLCQSQVIMMMEKLAEWLAGETEVLRGNLPQCHFVHHKPHMLPGRHHGGKPASNRLSYGTA
jgi:hypothetical protein